ncbi:MAG: nuclear transport factor 2 family protein [Pseudomonadota bacterium]
MKLNPNNTWRLVQERMEQEEDPKTRRNLELVLQHMKSEAQGDIEGVVDTLCENPKYVTHDVPDEPSMNPSGDKDAVRAFYDLTIVQTGAHQLELNCDRVIADHESVVTEGVMRMAYPGATLAAMGVQVEDPDAFYLYQTRMSVVWPVDAESGLLTGEETYTGTDGFAGIAERMITAADIVPLSI